ncbi:MAG: transcriptional regulator protein [Methanosarcinales archaeon]|nr:transcriptional regulator protein [Methanosarcinales archaeon]
MIELEVKILDENDLVFVSDLRNLGIQRNVALTLVYLLNVKAASSREIEIGTSLRQPEISTVLNFMIGNNWLDSRMVRVNKKGRPLKIYSLCVPMEVIYGFYESKAHRDYEESVSKINQLKELIQKNDK